MNPPRLHTALSFACLLIPALLLAWFHATGFPNAVAGLREMWGTPQPFPAGFDLLCQFGFLAYFPLLFIVSIYALSWRFSTLAGPLSVALCGGVLAFICVFYLILMSLPAIAHGAHLSILRL